MPFDLVKIRAELAGDALIAPLPRAVAIAAISDCWRLAGLRPIGLAAWPAIDDAAERLGVLAYLLVRPPLRDGTIEALTAGRADMAKALTDFLAWTRPLSLEMLTRNAFRQEEFVRWWVRALAGAVAAETAAQSDARLRKLDYKQTLAEYDAAEKSRIAEAERRAKALAEAAEKEAEARGWRE